MKKTHWLDLIKRSVESDDAVTLDLIAAHLSECESAKSILRQKGYGVQGMSTEGTARLVPRARD